MGAYDFNCANCGKTGAGTPTGGSTLAPKGWVWNKSFGFGRKAFCSNRCLDEYNSRNSSSESSSNSKQKSGGFIASIINDDDEKRPKTEAEIAADERRRKEVQESDAKLFDGIKKLFLGKKNKAAKELHSKLEEIEADIRIAISKGDKDEAGRLIRQLKHDSTLFVPKTSVSYSKYWADKREECLNKL